MTTSFYNSLSGLKSFQSGIDIWGDNIANVNTPGFKENIPEFETIFSDTITNSPVTSDIAQGSTLHSSAINLQNGSLKHTDNLFDLAIGGKGWFKVQNGNNEFYTKNGSFNLDAKGYLTDDSGNYLLVANANNIKKNENNYYIDPNIDTNDLVDNAKLSPIAFPENIIFPATPTDEIKIKANLNNSKHITNPANAQKTLSFSALYDKNGDDLNMFDNQSIVYKLENIQYNKGIFSDEICIKDDTKDGKEISYDFSVNNTPVKITLPDGSSKKEIINALAKELQKNNIDFETTDSSVIIKSSNSLIIKSNNNLVKTAAGATLVYKNEPKNPYEFNSLDSFKNILQTMLNNVYQNIASVDIQNGKIVIKNNDTIKSINSSFLKTDNTNDLFFNNISSVANIILPQTSAKSAAFKANIKNFGGDLYDKEGNKDQLYIQFTKKETLNANSLWEANIQIKNGDILINQKTQDFLFDSKGNLISPKSIQLSSPQNINLITDITAYSKIDDSFLYTQNGALKGELRNYHIDNSGNIFADFTNEKSAKIATIPLFHFQNPQGLESIGGNLFKETSNSNKAFVYKENGKYIPGSQILSNTIETSNVNLSQAMTQLIIHQKAFSAAAKTITTSDQMIQKAINMKR